MALAPILALLTALDSLKIQCVPKSADHEGLIASAQARVIKRAIFSIVSFPRKKHTSAYIGVGMNLRIHEHSEVGRFNQMCLLCEHLSPGEIRGPKSNVSDALMKFAVYSSFFAHPDRLVVGGRRLERLQRIQILR